MTSVDDMAQVHTVYSGLQHDPAIQGELFSDLRIWVAIRVPMRSTYVQNIQTNGGTIVKLEKDADVLIADHMRREAPPNSLSYTWIEACMRAGNLVDKEGHWAGVPVAAPRPVGALKPAKSGRAAYTPEDDRDLYNWVKDQERQGGKLLGNEIYKQLEQKNPRHPWQSWRDRYIKYVSMRPDADFLQATPPTPPSEDNVDEPTMSVHTSREPAASVGPQPRRKIDLQEPEEPTDTDNQRIAEQDDHTDSGHRVLAVGTLPVHANASPVVQQIVASSKRSVTPVQGQRSRRSNVAFVPRTDLDVAKDVHDHLHNNVPKIQKISVGEYDEIWDDLERGRPEISAADWREYYETIILPEWEKNQKHKSIARRSLSSSSAASEQFDDAVEHPTAAKQSSPRPSKHSQVTTETISKGDTVTAAIVDITGTSGTSSRLVNCPVVVIGGTVKNQPAVTDHPSPPTFEKAQLSLSGVKRKADVHTEIMKGKRQHVEAVPSNPMSTSYPSPVVMKHSPQQVRNNTFVDLVDLLEDDEQETANGYDPSKQIGSHPAFEVYESHEIPEGEKENFNGSGSPVRHTHVKSEGALEVFTDPPSGGFMLQEPGTPVDQPSEQGGSLADIDALEEEEDEDKNEVVNTIDYGEEGDPGDILDELRGEYESRLQGQESDEEVLQDWKGANTYQDTQAILDAQTQIPDFGMPLPPDESQDEDDEESIRRPVDLPQMSQEDQDSLFVTGDLAGTTGNREEVDGEGYDAYRDYEYKRSNTDLDMPPPPGTDAEAAYDEEMGDIAGRHLQGEQASGIVRSSLQHRPHGRAQHRNSPKSSYDGDIKLFSSSPRSTEHNGQSLTSALAPPHPTISTISVRKDLSRQSNRSNLHPPSTPPTPIPSRDRPPRPSSTSNTASAPDAETLITQFINAQTSKGHSHSTVIYALQRTNLDGALAERVLQSIERDGVVPPGVKGIWTEEDDKVMQGSDAGGMRRLEEKHGRQGYSLRVEMAGVWGLL